MRRAACPAYRPQKEGHICGIRHEGTANCSTKCTTADLPGRTASGPLEGPASVAFGAGSGQESRPEPGPNPHSRVGAFRGRVRSPQAGGMKASILLAALLLVLVPASAPARGAPGPASPAGGWSWPLSPRPAVLRGFDPPDRPWLSGHRGVDLRAAYDGAPVTSPAPGRVSFAGFVVDRPVITVDHGNGLRSSFRAGRKRVAARRRGGRRVGAGTRAARPLRRNTVRPLGRAARR